MIIDTSKFETCVCWDDDSFALCKPDRIIYVNEETNSVEVYCDHCGCILPERTTPNK